MPHLFIYLLSFLVCHAWPPKSHPLSIGTDTCRTDKDTLTGKQIYLNADTGPECEGGPAAWLKHVNKTVVVRKLRTGEVRNTYVIAFIVDKNGAISGERSVNGPIDDVTKQLFTAARTIRWIPGKCHEKNVTMLHKVPIVIEYQIE